LLTLISDVGRFNNATKMNVDTFREGLEVLDKLIEGRNKNEAIYMYCTGGIRCSVAGAYISNKGYSNVNMVSILNIAIPFWRDKLSRYSTSSKEE
jgi:predicted sulfurtransferase